MAQVVFLPRVQAISKPELDECGRAFERTWVASRWNAGLAPSDDVGDVFGDTAPGFGIPSLSINWYCAIDLDVNESRQFGQRKLFDKCSRRIAEN